jgi:hypothetical protein
MDVLQADRAAIDASSLAFARVAVTVADDDDQPLWALFARAS